MTQNQINAARKTTSPTARVSDVMRECRRLASPRLRSRDGGGTAAGAPIRRWSVAQLIAEASTRRTG